MREAVTLYVLADHGVQKLESFGNSVVPFAGWIEPSDLAAGSPIGPFVDRRLFLTEFRDTVEPARVNDDFHIRFAETDSTYRDEVVVYEQAPARDASPAVVDLAALAALAAVALLWRRRPARSPGTVAETEADDEVLRGEEMTA